MPEPVKVLYTGLLKIWMTAIQEDYPEFLSDFQFGLVSELPDNCVSGLPPMLLCTARVTPGSSQEYDTVCIP